MTDKTRLQKVIKDWADERTDPSGSPARLAANSSTPAAAGDENTVTRPADRQPTGNGEKNGRHGDMLTQQDQENRPFYLPEGFARNCDHCGREYTAKRDTSRFCSTNCRVAAHKARREAGGGRVGLFLALGLVAFGLWFFWPLLQQIAAMRPTLPATPTAVPVYPVTWPEAPQAAPTAVPQAAPDLVVTAVSPAPAVVPAAIVTNDVKPAPTAVPIVIMQPAPAGGIITIEAAGRTWHLTSERLADCVTAQAAGRQTGMACPPNAAKYAGAPGTPAQALYSQFNGRLAYCLAGGGWTPEYSQTLAAAFDAWSGSGVNFSLVDMGTSCQLPVSLVYNPSSAYAGRASEGPIGAWLAMNTYYGFNALVAMHEIGHVLGLGHWPSGVMTADGYYTAPGAAELAAVAALWGGGGR